MTPHRLLLGTSLVLASALSAFAGPIQHEFLAIDEGMSNLLYVNEADPSHDYVISLNKPHPRDMQLEGGGKLLISHDLGYSEIDIKTGKILTDNSTYHDVSSARRLENGDLLLFGVDFDQKKLNKGDQPVGDPTGRHVLAVEYSPEGKEVKRTTWVGDYLRLARETASGNFLFACNTEFKEVDKQGNLVKEFKVPGFQHAWKALRLSNGDTVMSAGYGPTIGSGETFMVVMDSDGKVVRKWGDKTSVPAEIHPYFYATFQVLPNDDIVVANWQGHGKTHGSSGRQIVEFGQDNKVVWSWSDASKISSIQAVLVLDGLDIAKRYDERGGVMGPISGK